MKILVTGANGSLGTAVTARLSKKHEVYALVRDLSLPTDNPSVHYLQHDFRHSPDKLYSQIDSLDAIVHTAQSRLYRDFPNSGQEIFDINVKATMNLLDISRHFNVKTFLFTSSGTVYEPYESVLTEDRYVNPTGFYGVTKFLSEKLISCYHSYFNVCVFRLFFLYGNFFNSTLIPSLISKVQQRESIKLEGHKGFVFSPTHVNDVANLIELAIINSWQGTINVASPENTTLKEIVLKICDKLNRSPCWDFFPDKNPPQIIPSLAKLQSLYREMNFISLDAGLDQMIAASPLHA